MSQTQEGKHRDDAVAAIGTLLSSQEAQVLGAIGLFIGYLCSLLTKVMQFEQPYVGVIGVIGLTALLLLISRPDQLKSLQWWLRSFVVIVIALILTAPALHNAWTVSVGEVRATKLQAQAREVEDISKKFVAPVVKIGEPKSDPKQ